jgi:hypothetical protein
MAIDPVDTARDDARRADEKKSEVRREQNRAKTGQEFSARYQGFLHAKEKEKSKLDAQKESDSGGHASEEGRKDANIFSKVIEAFRGRDEGHQQEKKELQKKEELKKEESTEKGDEPKSNTRAEDGHQRVDSTRSRNQDSHSGYNQGGGGNSSGGGQQNAGGQGSFSGNQGQQQFGKGQQASDLAALKSQALKGGQTQGESSNQGQFNEKVLDDIVGAVSLQINHAGESEMEIQLTDSFFAGVRLVAKKTSSGIVLAFRCPTREIRNVFLMHRPLIYARLKEKNILVGRIEIELV